VQMGRLDCITFACYKSLYDRNSYSAFTGKIGQGVQSQGEVIEEQHQRCVAPVCIRIRAGQQKNIGQCVAGAHRRARRKLGRILFWRGIIAEDEAVILVDTSVIVAWLDRTHTHHKQCTVALTHWAGRDQLAVSSVTYAELAAGARTREGVDEDLKGFVWVELDFDAAWRAGQAFRQFRPGRKEETPVLPDFFIRGQAATLHIQHLTNDRRRLSPWTDVDFLFPED